MSCHALQWSTLLACVFDGTKCRTGRCSDDTVEPYFWDLEVVSRCPYFRESTFRVEVYICPEIHCVSVELFWELELCVFACVGWWVGRSVKKRNHASARLGSRP